jgi:hypothetical protein
MQKSIDRIMAFCCRGHPDDWVRFLVCGICRIGPGVMAFNTKQLGFILGKSKSSINGALSIMNWVTVVISRNNLEDLCRAIPYLARDPHVLRCWTIRCRSYCQPAKVEGVAKEASDDDPFGDFDDGDTWICPGDE